MHTPHNSQPGVNLGDDPDPAAELGSRLAATSQTVQGLLTNYLFYGQRRSSDRTVTSVRGLASERGHEEHSQEARGSHAAHTRHTTEARPTDQREAAKTRPGTNAASPASASAAPSLQLRVLLEPGAKSSEAVPPSGLAPVPDPLAQGALADDPVAEDSLALPPEWEPRADRDTGPNDRLR